MYIVNNKCTKEGCGTQKKFNGDQSKNYRELVDGKFRNQYMRNHFDK